MQQQQLLPCRCQLLLPTTDVVFNAWLCQLSIKVNKKKAPLWFTVPSATAATPATSWQQQQQQPQALLAGAGPWERRLYIVYIVYIVVYIYLSVYGKQQKKKQQRHSNLYGERPRRLRIFARSNSCSGAQAQAERQLTFASGAQSGLQPQLMDHRR